ncbi:MAG: protein-L-isoaspartate(D-aspartate) O-methyltransferase [candidate division WOR-3 bacterium]|nr:protein-L-isoaspartate(D-aspartate) O-methyltransferase [candidate division WOR-3 bacterium]
MEVNNDYAILRNKMVQEQLISRRIKNPKVLDAFRKVPRHLFVPSSLVHQAYGDYPLPIGFNQTISQPYIVAAMTEYLDIYESHRVLEIGTGSGYQTAILALLAKTVYSVERIAELSLNARKILQRLGYTNIRYKIGDGTLGWKEFAPFDRIIVTAASEFIPGQLQEQLAENGRIVIPLGKGYTQTLVLGVKHNGRVKQRRIFECAFVPLVPDNA